MKHKVYIRYNEQEKRWEEAVFLEPKPDTSGWVIKYTEEETDITGASTEEINVNASYRRYIRQEREKEEEEEIKQLAQKKLEETQVITDRIIEENLLNSTATQDIKYETSLGTMTMKELILSREEYRKIVLGESKNSELREELKKEVTLNKA